MDKFTTWKAIGVPFDQPNIDTNQLCPTRFNKVEKGPKYAQVLFHDLRFNPDGSEKPDFILNQPAYRRAGIIVAERNFGCGSSRESAVYALATFGIRSIIAPSFGDIFFNNCLKNSVVPVMLDADTCAAMRAQLRPQTGCASKFSPPTRCYSSRPNTTAASRPRSRTPSIGSRARTEQG